jgi:hypothetical protein
MSELMLGRLIPVAAREVWAHEAHHFTPWLLANADTLSQVLGMDLDIETAEHPVGGFSLDLIGRDRSTGELVIIENQLEISDHSHLGQILTYAGGTNPTNVIWVATDFRQEHRAALEWLNERTDERTRFFAVTVSVVRIGDSAPAPLFEVVVRPNDWGKQVKAATPRGRKWTEQDFYDALSAGRYVRTAAAARELYDYNRAIAPDSFIYWGEGATPSMTAHVPIGGGTALQPWSIYTAQAAEPSFAINFEWIHKNDQGVDESVMNRFADALQVIPAFTAGAEAARSANWRRRPGTGAEQLFSEPTALADLKTAFDILFTQPRPAPAEVTPTNAI